MGQAIYGKIGEDENGNPIYGKIKDVKKLKKDRKRRNKYVNSSRTGFEALSGKKTSRRDT